MSQGDVASNIERLFTSVEALLREHSQGLSEYNLFRLLQENQDPLFVTRPFGDTLTLFQRHFLLFHVLYRLRTHFREHKEGELVIHCVNIVLRPYEEARESTKLAPRDPLEQYYLDLTHLEATTRDDIEALMTAFWRRFRQRHRRNAALKSLGLIDPVDQDTIRKTYRRLALEHHPDRGGDNETLQRLNAAMDVLK